MVNTEAREFSNTQHNHFQIHNQIELHFIFLWLYVEDYEDDDLFGSVNIEYTTPNWFNYKRIHAMA